MKNADIEEFAKSLIRQVRDAAIQDCDRKLRIEARGPVAQRWREIASRMDFQSTANTLIPDIVDNTLFQLLRAIDQGQLQLSFRDSSGRMIDLTKDGFNELAGWYMGIPGWRSMYAKERFIDDFSDLR